ncbi:MAG: DUF1003 domain-containing protein [Candidatus Zambryskibacteria bacterium]|nr:DUF1003 domain-containing protein [Candidatus Zambryskibacteria bacterium]
MKKIPLSVEEIKSLGKPLRNINIVHREKLTRLEKFAVWVTENIGTMGFFFFILGFNILWILWNVLAPKEMIFDPSWSFLILLFINNILQILFMPLIMVGQNLQGRHSEARAEADFEVNTKAEKEIETILIHLENQNDMMLEILSKLEKK